MNRFLRLDALARHSSVLMLQGPNGPFFFRLAQRLVASGVDVTKVNFNAGDAWFFPGAGARDFNAPAADWPAWLADVLREKRVEAILLFGQWRPMHRVALATARAAGLPVYVFEEGYARPWWITMEKGGVNDASALHGVDFAQLPENLPEPVPPVRHRFAFAAMAVRSFWYCAAVSAGRHRFPHYRHHRPVCLVEAGRWLRCVLRKGVHHFAERRTLHALLDPVGPDYFLVPLQLDADSQIRYSSDWGSNARFIEGVLRSFAGHADPAHCLVFRHHPLERGHQDYRRAIVALAASLGVADRVRYVHEGSLPCLLKRSRGVVLVNSTAGIQALHHDVPVCATGRAFYARPELGVGTAMDEFWRRPVKPDRRRFLAFHRHMLDTTQINMSFYARDVPFFAWRPAWMRVVARVAYAVGATVLLGSGACAPVEESSLRMEEMRCPGPAFRFQS